MSVLVSSDVLMSSSSLEMKHFICMYVFDHIDCAGNSNKITDNPVLISTVFCAATGHFFLFILLLKCR